MKKRFTFKLGGATLALGLVLCVPVLAQAQQPSRASAVSNAGAQAEAARDHSEQIKQEAQTRVEQIKQEVEERRAEIKQQVCERQQEVLQSAIPRLASGATNVKSSFDTIYERVQGFYADGQLTVENYAELTASVDAAQANAAAAVGAVETYNFELDCDNPNVGAQLDSFRQAVTEARATLVAYRDQMVALVSAMRAEAAEQQDQNSGEERSDVTRSEEESGNAQ